MNGGWSIVKHCRFTIGNQIYPFTINLKLESTGTTVKTQKTHLHHLKKPFVILLHIGYWILYLLLILLFILFIEAGNIKTVSQGQLRIFGMLKMMSALTVVPGVIGFYTFYSVLFDRYLAKKRIVALCIAAIITSLIAGLMGLACASIAGNHNIFTSSETNAAFFIGLFMTVLALIHGIIALVMKGFISWYADIKVKEALLKKNFETELALVKSQLSPHFLFNTINNIDVLIEKDATKASAYLNKLSHIMRFMLYETKTELIPLQKEITYIEKYIDLQKIRTANQNFIQYSTDGNFSNWSIAPMLFIPFIENAFKHSINKKTDGAIVIKLTTNEQVLEFFCDNHFGDLPAGNSDEGGLGNDLIKKRLQLLYPGKHQLLVSNENNIFKVHLTIFANAH